jgi:hypothetical protein
MRIQWLLGVIALAGCNDSKSGMPVDAGVPADVPADASAGVHPDASVDTGGAPAELVALLTEAVAAYDRGAKANCECLVERGGFDTVDECLVPIKSGPTWIPCGLKVLAANDSPQVRATARCLADALDARTACLSNTRCDSDASVHCPSNAILCAANDTQLVVDLLQACPDLGLLSRL